MTLVMLIVAAHLRPSVNYTFNSTLEFLRLLFSYYYILSLIPESTNKIY